MVTDDERKLIGEFQFFQQQLQAIVMQKENMKIQNLELDIALDELGKTKEKDALKIVGPILIKKPITELKKEMQDKKEDIDVKVKSLEQTEEKVSSKLKEMEPKVREILKMGK